MKKHQHIAVTVLAASLVLGGAFVRQLQADDAKDDAIKEFMKAYHKAPKGVDPVCKKATQSKATPDELKKLVEGYKVMCAAKPRKGTWQAGKRKPPNSWPPRKISRKVKKAPPTNTKRL